jgi:predicted CXXCH cytochrome family protein
MSALSATRRRVAYGALAALLLAGAALLLLRRQPPPLAPPAFAGTATCATCHHEAYRNWLQSDHRHAMEVADAHSVLGDFNNATFDYFGTRSRFFSREGEYFVETENAQGQPQTFRIAYTFGHYPLQQYLIAFPDGRLQALGISWDSRPAAQGGQRWYHLHPEERITADDPLHWTGALQNWNSRCADCHSTGLVKNYDADTNRYSTHWQEINVGCEACHGPGSQHVAWANGRRSLPHKGLVTQVARTWEPVNGQLPIPQQPGSALSGQLQMCAGCHSRRAGLQQPDASASYFDNYNPGPVIEGRYFADGQMREEVYELGSFLQSRMHQNQVSCSNCHEPHTSRLRREGNGLCLQCHEARRFQTREHFFHEPDSSGAQCVNCHMPQHTYMGVDVRRDHSFRVPDPQASVQWGVPNACTQCHKDRSDRWAADVVARRTGRTTPYYAHTRLLAAARNNEAAIVPELLAFARDSSRPAVLRSAAILESGRFPSAAQLAGVDAALASSDPLLRLGGVAALAGVSAQERLVHLQPLLGDRVKSVRVAVARALIDLPLAQVPEASRPALAQLFEEYRQSLRYNADMPESMSDLGLLQAAQGELDAAEKSLLHARRLSPRYLPAMLNLADVYREQNRDAQAEPLLREAVAAYPQSADAQHALGLLLVRGSRTPEAIPLFEQASKLAPGNARYALVHALSLLESGRQTQGLQVLDAAAKRFPEDEAIQRAHEGYHLP